MRYVDGFLIPIRRKNLERYKNIARRAGEVWLELGALEYMECVGDDLRAKGMSPFPVRAKTKPGETVVFSWIVYQSKGHRDRVNAKVMKDPRILKIIEESGSSLFDIKRMSYGGFKAIVDKRR